MVCPVTQLTRTSRSVIAEIDLTASRPSDLLAIFNRCVRENNILGFEQLILSGLIPIEIYPEAILFASRHNLISSQIKLSEVHLPRAQLERLLSLGAPAAAPDLFSCDKKRVELEEAYVSVQRAIESARRNRFTRYDRSQELRAERDSVLSEWLRYCIEVESSDKYQEKFDAIREFLKSDSIRNTMERAVASTSRYASGCFKVKFVRDTSFLPVDSPGCMNWQERTMTLQEDMSFKKTAKVFVFELFNAIQAERFKEVHQQAADGRLSREEYVRAIEEVEFQTGVLQHRTMVAACSELGWDPAGLTDDFWHYERIGFDRFWEMFKTTDHANYYRRDWDRCFSQFFFK